MDLIKYVLKIHYAILRTIKMERSEYIYHFMYLRMLLVITFILLQLPLFISLANLHFIETYRIFFVVNQNHKDNTYISYKCIGFVAR